MQEIGYKLKRRDRNTQHIDRHHKKKRVYIIIRKSLRKIHRKK